MPGWRGLLDLCWRAEEASAREEEEKEKEEEEEEEEGENAWSSGSLMISAGDETEASLRLIDQRRTCLMTPEFPHGINKVFIYLSMREVHCNNLIL